MVDHGSGRRTLAVFSKLADRKSSLGYADFASLVGPLQDIVWGSDFVQNAINREIAKISEDPLYANPYWEAGSITLASNKAWSLRVGYYARESEYIYTCPCHMVVLALNGGSFDVDHYAVEQSVNFEVFEPGVRIGKRATHTYAFGNAMCVDSARDIIDLHPKGLVPVVKLTSVINQKLQWAFDRNTLSSYQAISANPDASDLVAMAKTLMAMGSSHSAEALAALYQHESHFVRWASIQAMSQVAPEQAVELLSHAVDGDRHPHVRAASSRVLARLQGGASC